MWYKYNVECLCHQLPVQCGITHIVYIFKKYRIYHNECEISILDEICKLSTLQSVVSSFRLYGPRKRVDDIYIYILTCIFKRGYGKIIKINHDEVSLACVVVIERHIHLGELSGVRILIKRE